MNAAAGAVAHLAVAPLAATGLGASRPHDPLTEVHLQRDTLHGVVIEDPYRGPEDQDAAGTRVWIARPTAFSDSLLATVPGRAAIRARLAQLLENQTGTTPVGMNAGGPGDAADPPLRSHR